VFVFSGESMRRYVAYVMILVLSSQLSLFAVHAYEGSQIVCPLLLKTPKVDGKWTTSDEWSDAVVVTLVKSWGSSRNATAYLYAKHDESNFYFLVDFVSATSLKTSEGAGITLDPLHNGGNTPQSDDRRFDSSSAGGSMAIGTGGPAWEWGRALPKGVEVKITMSNSSSLTRLHQVSEFKIPFAVFVEPQDTIGFTAAAYAGGYQGSSDFKLATWPKDDYRDIPATWGELTLSGNPIPEFGGAWFVMAVIAVLSVSVMSRLANRPTSKQEARWVQPHETSDVVTLNPSRPYIRCAYSSNVLQSAASSSSRPLRRFS
jgi:hypothetical protein